MKRFDIPVLYQSDLIKSIHAFRNQSDPRKKDFRATQIDFKSIRFIIARSFGFCYGVENAVERVYRALTDFPDKRIFLLSQMIHNPDVNADLQEQGVRFILDTYGNQLIDWQEVTSDDLVIIPAFGTSVETKTLLEQKGIEYKTYDTTCPFVTRVWKRAEQLGKQGFNLIIHGKHIHEETKATFSHALQNAEALVIKNMEEAHVLADYIIGNQTKAQFLDYFEGKFSADFDPEIHLDKVGLINQTTMLASETSAISDVLVDAYKTRFGDDYKNHIANTRDTLCYATNENQDATIEMLKNQADLAVVVGGYNSSNTSHLVELCEDVLPTFYISNAKEIESKTSVNHYNFRTEERLKSDTFLEGKTCIMLTCGASCPDAVLNEVMTTILGFYPESSSTEEALKTLRILD
ncbi:MAG: 4-hydroxy-3-methylbut-2-enyl diphosphate reductase [Flavobacteriales bacterium]